MNNQLRKHQLHKLFQLRLVHRVFIGPDVSKAKLQGMQSRISQMTGLSGSVVAYNP